MTTYRVLDFENPFYTVVFTHKEKEHVITAVAVVKSDNSLDVEMSKASISNEIIKKKTESDSVAPIGNEQLVGGTFTANEELVEIASNVEAAEEL